MQKKRIFVAINLPENIKNKLSKYRYDIPAKWTRKENLHITLNFLGYIADEELLNICGMVEETALNSSSFGLSIKKISYGAKNKIVWAVGEKTEELDTLKNNLDKNLNSSDNRGFTPHITLARIKSWDWQKIDPEDRAEIDEEINLNFQVNSIEIMESVMKKEGPMYSVLQSYELKPF